MGTIAILGVYEIPWQLVSCFLCLLRPDLVGSSLGNIRAGPGLKPNPDYAGTPTGYGMLCLGS